MPIDDDMHLFLGFYEMLIYSTHSDVSDITAISNELHTLNVIHECCSSERVNHTSAEKTINTRFNVEG